VGDAGQVDEELVVLRLNDIYGRVTRTGVGHCSLVQIAVARSVGRAVCGPPRRRDSD